MKKIGLFFLFGVLQFGIDFILYTTLSMIGVNILYANIVSRGSAAIVGYLINGKYTFNKDLSTNTFVKFCIYWVFMTALSSSLLWLVSFGLNNSTITYVAVSKMVVELLLFMISFIIAKKMVYNNEKKT